MARAHPPAKDRHARGPRDWSARQGNKVPPDSDLPGANLKSVLRTNYSYLQFREGVERRGGRHKPVKQIPTNACGSLNSVIPINSLQTLKQLLLEPNLETEFAGDEITLTAQGRQ